MSKEIVIAIMIAALLVDVAAIVVLGLCLRASNKHLAEALNALRDLHDWQNGPPLETPKYERGWGNAMKQAKDVLWKHGA